MATVKHLALLVLLLHVLGQANAAAVAAPSNAGPIRKVVTLITSMKAEVEKAAEADLAAHDKYMCWCETTGKEKAEAIDAAGTRDEELSATIEEAEADANRLQEEIKAMETDLATDQDALDTAVSMREKEKDEFAASEKDTKETIALLTEAVATLEKVQLLQKKKSKAAAEKQHGEEALDDDGEAEEVQRSVSTALVQVREKILRKKPQFQNIMQRDLFDLMGSIDNFLDGAGEAVVGSASSATSFLGRHARGDGRKKVALVQEEDSTSQPKGAAAGAKSYNARSGGILGIMSEMLDETKRDLAESQKADAKAEAEFQKLSETKGSEISVAKKQIDRKKGALADAKAKAAKAKEDLKATAAAKEADETFLADLEKGCKDEDEDYKVRSKTRGEEIVALGETLKILTEDEARDLIGSPAESFVQLGSTATASARARSQSQARAKTAAARRVAQVARRHRSTQLAALAVSVQLDAFKEAKEAMDKMSAELTKQQQKEYEKKEFCNQEIDKTEDKIFNSNAKKDDLKEKHLQLSNTLRTLATELEETKKEEEEMKVSLKQAGLQRKEENKIFQTAAADAQATVNILKKARARLESFYSFAQIHSHDQERVSSEDSKQAPPPKPEGYEKHGGGGAVIEMLTRIIKDAEVEAQELEAAETRAQADYAAFVKNTAASIEAHRNAQTEKSAQKADAESERSETEESQSANEQELAKLNELLMAHHQECDWLLKYFEIRQTARAEEMDAIADAKAILSGAK